MLLLRCTTMNCALLLKNRNKRGNVETISKEGVGSCRDGSRGGKYDELTITSVCQSQGLRVCHLLLTSAWKDDLGICFETNVISSSNNC